MELEQTYARAWALCQQLEETASLCPILLGLGLCAMGRGQLQKARELLEPTLTLAQQRQDGESLMRGDTVMGITLLFLGEFVAAHAHFERGIAISEVQTRRSPPCPAPWHPPLTCPGYDALSLWLLGYPEQGAQLSHATRAMPESPEACFLQALAIARRQHARSLELRVAISLVERFVSPL